MTCNHTPAHDEEGTGVEFFTVNMLKGEEFDTEDQAEVAAKEACKGKYKSATVYKKAHCKECRMEFSSYEEYVSEWYWDFEENIVKEA